MDNLGDIGRHLDKEITQAEYYRQKTIWEARKAIKSLEDLRRELPEHFKNIIRFFDKLAGQDQGQGIQDHMIHSLTPALVHEIKELKELARDLNRIPDAPAKEAARIVGEIRNNLVEYRNIMISGERNHKFPTLSDARNALIHILVPLGKELVERLKKEEDDIEYLEHGFSSDHVH